jgi:hypothetical protein
MEHMIQPLVNPGMLQSQNILGLFHDANLGAVSLVAAAGGAGVSVGNIEADGAQPGLLF